jgi:glutaredoxin 3
MTGQRTVPNVFVKGKHLGGCDDTLAAIQSGKFQQMLDAK